MVLGPLHFKDDLLVLPLAHPGRIGAQDLAVVVSEELVEKLGVSVVHDQVLVSADGAGVAGLELAPPDAGLPGRLPRPALGEVPAVELPHAGGAIGLKVGVRLKVAEADLQRDLAGPVHGVELFVLLEGWPFSLFLLRGGVAVSVGGTKPSQN